MTRLRLCQRFLFVDPNLPIVTAFRTVLLSLVCWYSNQAMAPSPASGSTAHQGDHAKQPECTLPRSPLLYTYLCLDPCVPCVQ